MRGRRGGGGGGEFHNFDNSVYGGGVDFEGAEIFARSLPFSIPPSIRGTNFHFHALPRSAEHVDRGFPYLLDTQILPCRRSGIPVTRFKAI